ncbi:hypothetical protein [Yoonia sp. 208BN28-4]|uniref:hypothetical protein n=1 Tax=Yoonia sp. 208BN28-4 TaxID=3126505 RepID=UPI0030A9B702
MTVIPFRPTTHATTTATATGDGRRSVVPFPPRGSGPDAAVVIPLCRHDPALRVHDHKRIWAKRVISYPDDHTYKALYDAHRILMRRGAHDHHAIRATQVLRDMGLLS